MEAETSIHRLAATGATAAAIVPFLWQANASSDEIIMGNAVPEDRIRAGIAQVQAAGLSAVVKPHVWVPDRWAGAILVEGEGKVRWHDAYRKILLELAGIAQNEQAEVLVLGTELRGMSDGPRWAELIKEVRRSFSGRLTYVAHGADEAERVAFWPLLDAVAVSLYPPLGADNAQENWRRAIETELDRVEAVARNVEKPVWIAEIGIRSAEGAAARPWESAEERAAQPDLQLQAAVLSQWLHALKDRKIDNVWIWRWLTDPEGGGQYDTDFTVQNKLAESRIGDWWREY
ncbi:hypothetical protein LCM15_02955 [Salipiger bermudensis]|nr:hypothetical protein [Salipiger bermudensis]MCA0961129.1 hypothetical protein [Salipiger bermudensis]